MVVHVDEPGDDEPAAHVELLGAAERVERGIGDDLHDPLAAHDDRAIRECLSPSACRARSRA
jgi:hypothetical protein